MPIPPPPLPATVEVQPFHAVAPTPPMGWNSWDCFGTAVTEAQTKANADYMAAKLLSHGYQYVVVDIQWYEPHAVGHDYRAGAVLEMDANGRLLPATNKFPSAADGRGFAPLAEYCHAKGLKFGIHMMRGIARQAVERNLPVFGTDLHARDIADTHSTCPWNKDMYGVEVAKPGGQAYYDGLFKLVASWGVDFVKVDDLSRPYPEHRPEIEAIRRAIDGCGRPIVLSMSPGETPPAEAQHAAEHANLWRISDDFWDSWPALKSQFARCATWAPVAGPGHWPDADMLPVGRVRAAKNGWTHFTHDEQVTLLTLWCMARSPLMIGGDLPANDAFTLDLLTNDEVLAVDQTSQGGRQLSRVGDTVVWVARGGTKATGSNTYVALFNLSEKPADVAVPLADLGDALAGHRAAVRDLWQHRDLGTAEDNVKATVAPHGAVLLRLTPG
jgi:alpha-galactosidase